MEAVGHRTRRCTDLFLVKNYLTALSGQIFCNFIGRALEDALDQRGAELIALRKAAVQQAAAAPGAAADAPLQSALGRWGNRGDGSRCPFASLQRGVHSPQFQ